MCEDGSGGVEGGGGGNGVGSGIGGVGELRKRIQGVARRRGGKRI